MVKRLWMLFDNLIKFFGMQKDETMPYKYCLVPKCKNTTAKTKHKLFISVPRDAAKRRAWQIAMRRDDKKNPKLSNTSSLWCCEDHFLLEDDLENYWHLKLAGRENVKILKLKDGVIPHIFECQKNFLSPPVRKEPLEKKCKALLRSSISEPDVSSKLFNGGMPACSAYGCSNTPEKTAGISFHRFPKEPQARSEWIKACGRVNWQPSLESTLCSNHFTEDQLDRSSPQKVCLCENAVPNVFKSFSSCQEVSLHTQTQSNLQQSEMKNGHLESSLKSEVLLHTQKQSNIQQSEMKNGHHKSSLKSETSDVKAEFLHKARDSALKCPDINKRVKMLIEIFNHCLYFHEVKNSKIENLAEVLLADLEQLLLELNLDVNDETSVLLETLRNALKISQIKEEKEIFSD